MIDLRPARPADLQGICELLLAGDLFVDDVGQHLDNFVVFEQHGNIVATGGMELYPPVALLRSIAVDQQYRSKGIAIEIVNQLCNTADMAGVQNIYLLTNTATGFFERLNFRAIARTQAPDEIKATSQFSHLCPASAQFMYKRIQ